MNTALFYDTETTGLPLFKEPSDDPRQPHIVQLGAALIDLDTRVVLSSLDVIVQPDGWEIPEEVSRVHGITTEHALDVGIPEQLALAMLASMGTGRTRIAHNEQFDARIVRIAMKRFMPELVDGWAEGEAQCTARMTTKLCALPPTAKMRAAGRTHFKTPNLCEAYQHFTGKPLDGAHNAMVDVKACAEVYFGAIAATDTETA